VFWAGKSSVLASLVMFIKKLIKRIIGKKSGVELAQSLGVRVGQRCKFIGVNKQTFGSEAYLIEIGDHVEISSGVRFFTHDGGVWVFRENEPDLDSFGTIVVGNNVFIGHGSVILKGARISDNCVIGAGSVVIGEIPPNSVAAGVPAKVIKHISDYRSSVSKSSFQTKRMTREQKKAFLVEHFCAK